MRKSDSSCLIALSELRELEADRVQREEQARQQAAEAERLAREHEEQRLREQAERAAAEEAARLAAEREAQLERERHDRMRVMEAEARARAEHEARLQQEQMWLQHQVKMSERRARPRWPLVVVPMLLLGVFGTGVMAWLGQQEAAREQAERQRFAEEQVRAVQDVAAKIAAIEAEQTRLQQQREALEAKIAAAKGDAAAEEALHKQLESVQTKIATNERKRGGTKTTRRPRGTRSGPKPTGDTTTKPTRTRPTLDFDSDTKDPLAGIK